MATTALKMVHFTLALIFEETSSSHRKKSVKTAILIQVMGDPSVKSRKAGLARIGLLGVPL